MKTHNSKPLARTSDILTRSVCDSEMVVYDRSNDKVHCLNRTATLLYRFADGTRSARDLSAELSRELGEEMGEDVVLLGIEQLRKAKLMEQALPGAAAPTRRAVLARLGAGAAIAATLPVVASILAPTPASALTCKQRGEACSSNFECCSGLCLGGGTCA
jgi:hypothetical protein